MFDIGFSEILVIAGLSLVVLGPDKLPRVVKTVGRWAGRARAMARQFSDQLAAEADNLKFDLDSKATNSTAPPASAAPPGHADSAAAAAAAAAPTLPPEFTGAPLEAATEPSPQAEFPSANGSGHADLSEPEVVAEVPAEAPAETPAEAAGPYDPANPPIPRHPPA
jgi:sec-independent protein translocase protein TatB